MRKVLIASASVLLLAACQQTTTQAVAPPPAPPPAMAQPTTWTVLFTPGSSTLSSDANMTIAQAAAVKGATYALQGHTDTTGGADFNMALSQRRATAVSEALTRAGVPSTSITWVGTGETQLPVQTADNVAEQRNRSVDIVTSPQASIFSDPRAYCKALSDKWRQFRTAQVDSATAAAMAQCDAGNYDAGIPVLEDAFISNRLPLPAPGYRWPGRPV
jgi:hypothetical protein